MANSNGWGDGAANNAIGWGQGANNAIAWGDSHAKSWAGATDIVGLTTDPDAQAFITAAAITDPTQQLAIDNLVKGLKSDNIWTKMKAIYPFVGGTATTHKYNLKDPRDLDAAFRLVFNGGWTHSSNGATPNGTNGYADTKFNPFSNSLTTASANLSYYARTQATTSDPAEIGNFQTSALTGLVLQSKSSSLTNRYFYGFSNAASRIVATAPVGYMMGSSISNTRRDLYFNGTSVANNTTTDNTTFLNYNLFLGAANINNSSVSSYSNSQCAFSSIGDGLTDTEAANLYTRVQAYQTALSRNV